MRRGGQVDEAGSHSSRKVLAGLDRWQAGLRRHLARHTHLDKSHQLLHDAPHARRQARGRRPLQAAFVASGSCSASPCLSRCLRASLRLDLILGCLLLLLLI